MYEGERRCAILWSGRVKQRSQSNFSNIKGEGDTHFKSNQKVVSKLNLNFCKLKYKSKQNEMFNRIKKIIICQIMFPRTYLGIIQNKNDEKNLDLKNRKTFFFGE